MQNFREISASDLKQNCFDMINKDWMLITAEKEGKANTMTASWGGFGELFYKNISILFVRPQRYTREFLDSQKAYSLCFFDESYREKLTYCGRVSGRQEDKIANCNFTVLHEEGIPYFAEAKTVLLCKALVCHQLSAADLLDPALQSEHYSANDYHYVYYGEIVKVLQK